MRGLGDPEMLPADSAFHRGYHLCRIHIATCLKLTGKW